MVKRPYPRGMPRPFTTAESESIRAALIDAGAASFARAGIRRTTVEDLANAAGISKGAFYRFFESKEALFLALTDEYEQRMQAEIEAAVRSDPERGIDVLLDAALYAIERNPFLAVAMSEEGARLLRTRTPAEQRAYLERDERLVGRVLGVLEDAGVRPTVTPSVLLALLRSLFMLGAHRAEVGDSLAQELATWLIPTLRRALLATPGDATGWPTAR